MKKDLIITFFFEFTVLCSNLLIFRLAFTNFGDEGFAIYTLCRRNISFMIPVAVCGLGVAIPRYLAACLAKGASAAQVYLPALAIGSSITTIVVLALNLYAPQFAKLFFDDENLANLIGPLSYMVASFALHTFCYAYFRGKMQMVPANFLQLFNSALIPLIAFLFCSDVESLFLFTAFAMFCLTVVVLFQIILKLKPLSQKSFSFKKLMIYSFQRMPGDLGVAALFALPPILAAHKIGVVQAGYLAFAISLISMSGSVLAPIGLVLLPKASSAVARGDLLLLRRYVIKLLIWTISLVGMGIVIYEIFAEFILGLYLGDEVPKELVLTTRTIFLAALPYCIYAAMRSLIDAYYEISINTISICSSLLFMLSVYSMTFIGLSINTLFVISFIILSVITLVACKGIIKNKN